MVSALCNGEHTGISTSALMREGKEVYSDLIEYYSTSLNHRLYIERFKRSSGEQNR